MMKSQPLRSLSSCGCATPSPKMGLNVDRIVLPAAAAADDAALPAAPATAPAPMDPRAFTKWDVTEFAEIPIAEQKFNIMASAERFSHAVLIPFFLSDDMDCHGVCPSRGRQRSQYGFPANFPPPISRARWIHCRGDPVVQCNYRVRWCNATIEFFEGQPDDEGGAKRIADHKSVVAAKPPPASLGGQEGRSRGNFRCFCRRRSPPSPRQ
jgi:hypothetical protein